MGYRAYLYTIDKETQDTFVIGYSSYYNLYDHLEKNYKKAYPTRLPGSARLAEICPYFASEGGVELKKVYKFDVDEEEEYYHMSKDDMKALIEYYRKNIVTFYDNLVDRKGNFIQDEKNVATAIRGLWSTWRIAPYDLDNTDADSFIARSYRTEYDIFNLVYIYKTFDWDNNYLLYVAG